MNKQVQVISEGEIISCLLPGSLISKKNALIVGDQVEIGLAGKDQYKLIHVLPRKTALYRGNRRSTEEKVLVAVNVQYLLAIVTADYLLNQAGYLEAAIIADQRAGIKVGIFISKWDLIGENTQALLEAKLALYHTSTDFVFVGSARERQEELMKTVEGKTVVVVGDRSCGKKIVTKQSFKLDRNEYDSDFVTIKIKKS